MRAARLQDALERLTARQPRRMEPTYGSSCETVNDCSRSITFSLEYHRML